MDLRLLIGHHLKRWWSAAEIRGAGDSGAALKILDDYHPDLAVVDINLPGQDGLSLCRAPELAQTEILVLTGSREPGINEKSFRQGAAECLLKPFEPEVLHQAAQRLLGSPL